MVPYLRVVVTTRCGLRCAYCHAEGDPVSAGDLDAPTLSALINALVDTGARKIKFLGGEPLLRADLPEVIRAVNRPGIDLSVITSGTAPLANLDACFAAGLHRANISVHGFTREAFALRRGNARAFALREATLARLLELGRPLKLNYVYGNTSDLPDLDALLAWAAGRPLVVNVLDDLNGPVGPDGVRAAVCQLRGAPRGEREEPDPYSLPTRRLSWADGLEVEIKHQRLGQLAPWRACAACPRRERCGEGIDAIRLAHDGVLRPCMDRPDLGTPLVPVLGAGGPAAVTAAARCFTEGARA